LRNIEILTTANAINYKIFIALMWRTYVDYIIAYFKECSGQSRGFKKSRKADFTDLIVPKSAKKITKKV